MNEGSHDCDNLFESLDERWAEDYFVFDPTSKEHVKNRLLSRHAGTTPVNNCEGSAFQKVDVPIQRFRSELYNLSEPRSWTNGWFLSTPFGATFSSSSPPNIFLLCLCGCGLASPKSFVNSVDEIIWRSLAEDL